MSLASVLVQVRSRQLRAVGTAAMGLQLCCRRWVHQRLGILSCTCAKLRSTRCWCAHHIQTARCGRSLASHTKGRCRSAACIQGPSPSLLFWANAGLPLATGFFCSRHIIGNFTTAPYCLQGRFRWASHTGAGAGRAEWLQRPRAACLLQRKPQQAPAGASAAC
jgi:hypothetical protein